MPADTKPRARPGRYSDDERAEAVRLADELGSDNAAGKQLGISGVSIGSWRRAGHGKKPKSTITGENPRAKQPPAHDGPKTKCSVCKAKLPIEGEVGSESRLAALRAHYRDKPECEDALRKRHA